MHPAGTRLNYLELLSVSWLITWRFFALLMIFSFTGAIVLRLGIVGILATLHIPQMTVLMIADVIGGLTPFVLFYPVVVQMALTKEFRSFEIQATGDNGSPTSLTFLESLRPSLYFVLFTSIIGVPVALLAGMAVETTGTALGYANAAAALWSFLVAQPIAVHLMLRKGFRGFHFEITRAGHVGLAGEAPAVDAVPGE